MFRAETNLHALHSENQLTQKQQVYNNFLLEVEQQKRKVTNLVSLHSGDKMDALTEEIENLMLTVLDSRKERKERKSRTLKENDVKMESSIEKYLAEEELLEALEALVTEKGNISEEVDEKLRRARIELEQMNGSWKFQAKKLEELKIEIKLAEVETGSSRKDLERDVVAGRLRVEAMRIGKSDLLVKMAALDTNNLKQRQVFTRLSEVTAGNREKFREEEEKDRKAKEHCKELEEQIKFQNEETEILKTKVDNLQKVKEERDLMKEKLRQTREETSLLEKKVVSLSNVEQQVETLRREKSNLRDRSTLLQAKDNSYREVAASSLRRLQSTEAKRKELLEEKRILIEENENLKRERQSLSQELQSSREEFLKSKGSTGAKDTELNDCYEALKGAETGFERLKTEEEQIKARVLTLKSQIQEKKKESEFILKDNARLLMEKKVSEENLDSTLAQNSTASKELSESSETIDVLG